MHDGGPSTYIQRPSGGIVPAHLVYIQCRRARGDRKVDLTPGHEAGQVLVCQEGRQERRICVLVIRVSAAPQQLSQSYGSVQGFHIECVSSGDWSRERVAAVRVRQRGIYQVSIQIHRGDGSSQGTASTQDESAHRHAPGYASNHRAAGRVGVREGREGCVIHRKKAWEEFSLVRGIEHRVVLRHGVVAAQRVPQFVGHHGLHVVCVGAEVCGEAHARIENHVALVDDAGTRVKNQAGETEGAGPHELRVGGNVRHGNKAHSITGARGFERRYLQVRKTDCRRLYALPGGHRGPDRAQHVASGTYVRRTLGCLVVDLEKQRKPARRYRQPNTGGSIADRNVSRKQAG